MTIQIPQHVTALLSHLTSRPGVQSTFILSRRDGSIIQSTGLLAASLARNQSPSLAQTQEQGKEQEQGQGEGQGQAEAGSTQAGNVTGSEEQHGTSPEAEGGSSASTPTGAAQDNQEGEQEQTQGSAQQKQQQQQQKTPYQPTHAEALAAHIFAFVSSASDLSLSLSHPPETVANNGQSQSQGAELNRHGTAETLAGANANGVSSPRNDEGAGHENQEDDEVKLLRLRTRKHEIVVVPDRKYLLCVIHDAVNASRR